MEKSAEAGVESPQIYCPSDQQLELTVDDVNPATEKPTEAHQSEVEAEGDSHWITGRKVCSSSPRLFRHCTIGQGFLIRYMY